MGAIPAQPLLVFSLMVRSVQRNILIKENSMKKKLMLPILAVGILIVTMSRTSMVWAQAAPRTIDITVKRFSYDPGEITLKKGQPVVLVLKSADVSHGLRIRDLGVNAKVKAGGTA